MMNVEMHAFLFLIKMTEFSTVMTELIFSLGQINNFTLYSGVISPLCILPIMAPWYFVLLVVNNTDTCLQTNIFQLIV